MTSVPSATTWGSPNATKHALLLHGLTSSSHTWHRVASSLADQGYFVTAPNLVGHASRTSAAIDFYSFSSAVDDLRPYLDARRYSLIIGHAWGAVVALSLFPHLPPSNPTAIVLVDPPMHRTLEKLEWVSGLVIDSCAKSAKEYSTENPLWTPQDCIYRELGARLCSTDIVHAILTRNGPWDFFKYFDAVPDKCKMTVVVADPAINRLCPVEDILPYPHIRPVMVPGATHFIQTEFPDVIVEEALKRVAELDVD